MFSRINARIAALAIAWRVVSALVGWLAVAIVPLASPPQTTMFGRPNAWWDQFTRYDAGWYYQIARYGYWFVPGGPSAGIGKPGKIAYFPLYPFLSGWVGRLFGSSAPAIYLGLILVSWLAFAAAMVALYHLARLDLDATRAERAVLLTAVFPFSFFFGMPYTESLFLLLTLLAFLAFRRQRWIAGGVAGALTTATRVNGVLMIPSLAWIAWRLAPPRDRVRAAAGVVLVGAGVAAYSTYVYHLSGNPFEWASSISRWNYHPGRAPWVAPWQLLVHLATGPIAYFRHDAMAPYDTLYGVTAIVFIAAIPFVWLRFGAAYAIFMIANLWLPLSSGVFEGLGRYCSVLFPFFIWAASTRSRALFSAWLVLFLALYPIALALFVTLRPLF
ncbi:MAG TPA: glycosyltransferase family 39 protein [Vicinamibacterales bacterium]|nr:glycosyltransferase family 39 protein [Vicinamibacterales bacterium]